MVRSIQNFRNDLNRLYAMGFRPVTLHDYVNNRMKLPRGASPVVITFDDSDPSQLTLKADGTVHPHTAVGIWMSFKRKYPEFPIKGTFFVLPNGPFGQRKLVDRKIEILTNYGCEIGSHTLSHRSLAKLTDEEVIAEIAGSYEYLRSIGVEAKSFATPYGIAPKNRDLLTKSVFNGRTFGYENICLAGAGPAPSPFSPKFDRHRIPRIKAYDGPLGITYWQNRESNGKLDVYVQL